MLRVRQEYEWCFQQVRRSLLRLDRLLTGSCRATKLIAQTKERERVAAAAEAEAKENEDDEETGLDIEGLEERTDGVIPVGSGDEEEEEDDEPKAVRRRPIIEIQ